MPAPTDRAGRIDRDIGRQCGHPRAGRRASAPPPAPRPRLFNERRSIRLTYDRGDLEIRTLSPEHENLNLLLNHLVVAAAEELGLEIASYGSMTMRRRPRRRGLEADQCYWIANEARMRGRDRIDLRTDPPPDLLIRADVSRSPLTRMAIHSA